MILKRMRTDLQISLMGCSWVSWLSLKMRYWLCLCRVHNLRLNYQFHKQLKYNKRKKSTYGYQALTLNLMIICIGGMRHWQIFLSFNKKLNGNQSMCFMASLQTKVVTYILAYVMDSSVHLNIVHIRLTLDGKYADALVKEDIRQKLIFKQYPDKFLKYIQLFSERCL